jgi:hypothetical protein
MAKHPPKDGDQFNQQVLKSALKWHARRTENAAQTVEEKKGKSKAEKSELLNET